jgi:hypothetical protein
MIRQDANCDGLKWMAVLNRHVDSSQSIDLPDQEIARSVGEGYRKEKDPAIDFGTTISRHGGMMISFVHFA